MLVENQNVLRVEVGYCKVESVNRSVERISQRSMIHHVWTPDERIYLDAFRLIKMRYAHKEFKRHAFLLALRKYQTIGETVKLVWISESLTTLDSFHHLLVQYLAWHLIRNDIDGLVAMALNLVGSRFHYNN